MLQLRMLKSKLLILMFLSYVNAKIFPLSLDAQMTSEELPVNSLCHQHVEYYLQQLNLFNTSGWALKMFDSTGKLPDGIIEGNWNVLGSFYSCHELQVDDLYSFGGKFCYLGFTPAMTANEDSNSRMLFPVLENFILQGLLPFNRIGICFPDSCTDEDVINLMKNQLNTDTVEWSIENYGCQAKSDVIDLNASDWIFVSVMILILILVVAATCIDLANKYWNFKLPENKMMQILMAFSFTTNWKGMFDTRKQAGSGQLYCINGMRFLSMTWIIVGHTFDFSGFFMPWIDFVSVAIREPEYSILTEVIYKMDISVDTFFLMGGCVLGYITFKELDFLKKSNNGEISKKKWASFWAMFYIHRYLRLTMVYALILWFHVTLSKYLEIGINEIALSEHRDWCSDYWYTNFLYANNFWHIDTQCLGHTWYLSCEMQMFIFSPLLLYPLWRYKRAGKVTAAFWCIFSVAVPLIITAVFHWPISPGRTIEVVEEDWGQWMYYPPWTRCGPYVVGIILGYILHVTKNKRLNLKTLHYTIGWILAFITGLAVVYGANYTAFFKSGDEKTQVENVMYSGFHRFSWGVACAWVVFACVKGYGGIINSILSWKAFMPLAKTTYVGFLIHMSIAFCFFSLYRFNIEYSHFFLAILILTIVVTTVIVSFIIVLTMEIPLLKIEKLLLSPRKAKSK